MALERYYSWIKYYWEYYQYSDIMLCSDWLIIIAHNLKGIGNSMYNLGKWRDNCSFSKYRNNLICLMLSSWNSLILCWNRCRKLHCCLMVHLRDIKLRMSRCITVMDLNNLSKLDDLMHLSSRFCNYQCKLDIEK